MSDRTLTEQEQVLDGTVSVREVLNFIQSDRYLDLEPAMEGGKSPGSESKGHRSGLVRK